MRLKGKWNQGNILKGKWIMENGNYFEGSFENNLPIGKGFWIDQDGNITEGFYEQTERSLKSW